MRIPRILSSFLVGLLTIALVGLVPVAFVSSAQAAKPKRDISATFKDTGRKVAIKGKIKPGKLTKIIVQVRIGKAKKWRSVKQMRSNKLSQYTYVPPFGKSGVRYCYRFVVPGNKTYRKSYQAKYTYGTHKGAPMCVVTTRY